MLHTKFGFGWLSGFRGEDLGRTTEGRRPDHGHPISSPCEPNGSGELIMVIYMYIAPEWGHMSPWVHSFFSESLIFSPTTNLLQDFHLK